VSERERGKVTFVNSVKWFHSRRTSEKKSTTITAAAVAVATRIKVFDTRMRVNEKE
jgi:hypothetical protein